MGVPTTERAQALVHKLFERYLEVGHQANLTRATLANLAGVPRSRFYSMAKRAEQGEQVNLDAYALLRIKSLLHRFQEDLESGVLPAGSRGSKEQQHYCRRTVPDAE